MLSSTHYLHRSRPEDSHTHLLTCDGKENNTQKRGKRKKSQRVATVPGNCINEMISRGHCDKLSIEIYCTCRHCALTYQAVPL